MAMKIVVIIQARMGSTRLPGKVMKLLCGKTVLAHVVDRVRLCPLLDEVVVATTIAPNDDIIVAESAKCGAKWFRGSEEDVLGRYYLAAQEYRAEVIVRVTSDDPLVDPQVLTQMLEYFNNETEQGRRIDYLSNNLNRRSYPLGLDAEVFTFAALERAFRETQNPLEREHVTPYIRQHPEIFILRGYLNDTDLSAFRWTLDTEEDWKLISEIYSALYSNERIFTTNEVLALLDERPELSEINAHVQQRTL